MNNIFSNFRWFLFFVFQLRLFLANEEDGLFKFRSHGAQHFPPWVLHYPREIMDHPLTGQLLDVRGNDTEIAKFRERCDTIIWSIDGFTDGENVDTIEHFFWGKKNGIAMELGALDGSPQTRSMTFELENQFGWRRLLVEGNPKYKHSLKTKSSQAISIHAAICEKHQHVHFADIDYVGGIIEFMSHSFLKEYHRSIYDAGLSANQTFDLNLVPWQKFSTVHIIDCIPLHTVFSTLNLTRINFFILDVEGGEMEVMKSIQWDKVRFDVIAIETDPPNRPEGYANKVTAYMKEQGYLPVTGQLGRNSWFIHPQYEASRRSGLKADCFNGFRRSDQQERWWSNRRTPPFQPCQLT